MLKALLILFAIVCLFLGGIYYSVAGFDPDKKGQAVKEQIHEGMNIQEVFDIKVPMHYSVVELGELDAASSLLGPSSPIGGPAELKIPEDETVFIQEVEQGLYPDGCMVYYRFYKQTAFIVHFDGEGNVVAIEDEEQMPFTALGLVAR